MSLKNDTILISTGIYPPKLGGPAQYAKNLKVQFEKLGYTVIVRSFGIEGNLPTGIRHFFYFCKILPVVLSADAIVSLDTFSVGFPTALACKMLRKKHIIRTGGDFLWEGYVERTKKKVLLRRFYHTETEFFSLKEQIIFRLTQWTLNNTSPVIFSTTWQRDIFLKPYSLDEGRTAIIENYYGPIETKLQHHQSNVFLASTRPLVWKNLDTLKLAIQQVQNIHSQVTLVTQNFNYEQFLDVMKKVRAVVLVSLGDISPNMILDSIRLGIPFICTKEVGIFDRIQSAGEFVDPTNVEEIERAILKLLTSAGYSEAQRKVSQFSFTHTWEEIAREFLDILHT